MKKILSSLLCIVIFFTCTGCTPKLEDKTEQADYSKMLNKEFNAKYTYLKEVVCHGDVNSDLYPNNKAMRVYEKGTSNGYTIVVTDCDKGSNIKSRMGTEVGNDTINVNNAEVVAESLDNKTLGPTLLVKQSDIEIIEETKLEDILKSDKSYNEISGIFSYMMQIKDGRLNYDKEKYSQRVEALLKEYETEKARLDEERRNEERLTANLPKNMTYKYKIKFGKLLDATVNNNVLIIKAKIEPSISNKTTIHKNGFNIEDLILNQNASNFDEIQYWAVADMTDGSESKVISFTINKDLITNIKNKNVVGNQIVDYASDVWILPSLKQ